jgi:hypothetical protein
MRFRFFAGILAVLIASQLIGFVAYFQYSKQKIKKELKLALKEGVPMDQLVKFQFTASEAKELNWIKSNEFKMGDNYYDVVWKNERNDSVFFSCVNDIQETKLFVQLTQYVNFNLSNETPFSPLKSIFTTLQQPSILPEKVEFSLAFLPKEYTKAHFLYQFTCSVSDIYPLENPPDFG